MQIRTRLKTTTPESSFDSALERELMSAWLELSGLLNNGLQFSDNFMGNVVSIVDSGNADSENAVAHTLKKVPSGFHVVNIDKAGIVYSSATAWTESAIYLKCNVANCAIKVLIF